MERYPFKFCGEFNVVEMDLNFIYVKVYIYVKEYLLYCYRQYEGSYAQKIGLAMDFLLL